MLGLVSLTAPPDLRSVFFKDTVVTSLGDAQLQKFATRARPRAACVFVYVGGGFRALKPNCKLHC